MVGSKPYAKLKSREVNGARMAYVDEGEGHAIVFRWDGLLGQFHPNVEMQVSSFRVGLAALVEDSSGNRRMIARRRQALTNCLGYTLRSSVAASQVVVITMDVCGVDGFAADLPFLHVGKTLPSAGRAASEFGAYTEIKTFSIRMTLSLGSALTLAAPTSPTRTLSSRETADRRRSSSRSCFGKRSLRRLICRARPAPRP